MGKQINYKKVWMMKDIERIKHNKYIIYQHKIIKFLDFKYVKNSI